MAGAASDNTTTFIIEKVLETEYVRKVAKRFLIRWKGYTEAEDSWIDKACLGCPVEQFCEAHDIAFRLRRWQPAVGDFEPIYTKSAWGR